MPRLVGFTDTSGAQVSAELPYGSVSAARGLPLQEHLAATDLVPVMRAAVKTAEGNPRNHGVLSVKTANSADASRVLDNSIYNNYSRWVQAGKPGKFVDFMQKRWAPLGVSNDPKNLNKSWAPNVRRALQQNPNVDYSVLQANNIAMNQDPLGAFNV